jgi:hypothetical protein
LNVRVCKLLNATSPLDQLDTARHSFPFPSISSILFHSLYLFIFHIPSFSIPSFQFFSSLFLRYSMSRCLDVSRPRGEPRVAPVLESLQQKAPKRCTSRKHVKNHMQLNATSHQASKRRLKSVGILGRLGRSDSFSVIGIAFPGRTKNCL